VKKLFGLAAAGALFAGAVEAQAPTLEFGVDMGIISSKPDEGERELDILAPLNIRVGIVSAGAFSFEPRFAFQYEKEDDGSQLILSPAVNALFRLGPGTGLHNQMGPYLTGGVGLNFFRVSDDPSDESASATQLTFNVGVGTRLAWGNAAFRPEVFFGMGLEGGEQEAGSIFIPAETMFGLRLGVSVWR
jgi:hypothetical protein